MTTETRVRFQPVDAKRRALLVAEQVLNAIQSGALRPGDCLPSERSLADQTGVSRPSIREALSALQLVGALETRHGRGTFVSGRAEEATYLARSLSELYQSGGLADSLELRRVIEKSTAFLVVKHLSTDGLRTLSLAQQGIQEAADRRDFDALNVANTNFHECFAAATDNPLLVATFGPLSKAMLSRLGREIRQQRYWTEPGFFATSAAVHRTILEAVARGNIEDLLEAIDAHYDVIEQSL